MPIEEQQLVQVLLDERIRLLSFLVLIVHSEHVAEDIYQEVAMKAVKNRRIFEALDPLRAWLFRTAKNRALDHLR